MSVALAVIPPRTADPALGEPVAPPRRAATSQRATRPARANPAADVDPERPRITVRPAPRREPPFDDEVTRPRLHVVRGRELELPFPDARVADEDEALTRPVSLPDPGTWARRLILGLTEAAAGRRPLNQVAPLLSPAVARGLSLDFEHAAAAHCRHWLRGAVVRTVHVSEPTPGVAELAVTMQAAARVRAVALRLDARHGRWQCTRLQIG